MKKIITKATAFDKRFLRKVLIMIKIYIVILICSIYTVKASDSYAQNVRINLELNNVSLSKVIKAIKEQTEFEFAYDANLDQLILNKVSINVNNEKINNVLVNVLKGTNINFKVIDKIILLSKNTLKATSGIENEILLQKQKITGVVTDATTGVSLPGVTVMVKGTTKGTTTGTDGKYTLDLPNADAVLIFSFIGMKKQEILIGNQTSINVAMTSETSTLDEVVIVGYGTQKKATITGSVAAVGGEALKKSSSTNVSNSLAGRLPGLVVITPTGEPGNDASILRIRGVNTLGDNSPLIVVDGISHRSLDRLDPATIESVTVLKDASAAIYGSEAANGVILITTKRGSIGKPQVQLNLSQGWNTPTVLPKMADAANYAQMLNEIKYYAGQPARYSAAEIQKFKDGSDPWKYPNTDWFKATIKPFSPQRRANLSLNGGSESVKYFVSLGSTFQDGLYYNSATNYSQVDFKSNLDAKISKNIRLSVDLTGRQENRNYPGNYGNGYYDPYWAMNRAYPTMPATWPNGLPGPDVEYGANSTVITTDATGYCKNITYVMESNVKLDITIPWVTGLSITGNASFDKSILNHKQFLKPWYLYTWDGVTYDANNQPILAKGVRGPSEPNLSQSMTDAGNNTLNALINYARTIDEKHAITVLAGSEMISGNSMNFSAYRRYFTSTAIDQMYAGGDLLKDNGGSATSENRLSYFGRINYAYSLKYLAEFVWRYDGSYIFPQDKRFGFFPGVSLGWRISEEKFWKTSFPIINEFKLKGSWGKTGNDRIEPYQFLSSYGYNGTAVFNQSVVVKGLSELRIPNPNVTWEVANQSNIGFDGQMLNGRILISADYFYNLRTNILWWKNASVPATTGLSLPRQNIGKVANQGFELQIGYNNKIGDFSYRVSVNGANSKNKIIFWDETPGVPDYQKSTGLPVNAQMYYQAIGIFKDQAAVDAYPHWAGARPGDIIFQDVNKDGKIDGLDLVRNKKTEIPTFTGGMSIDLGYKNFYASLLVQGAAGAERATATFSGESGNFLMADVSGRWTESNPNATKPRAWNRGDAYWMTDGQPNNTYWLKSSDYMRLKNIEIGYNFPKSMIEKVGLEGLRIYLSGQNLLTKTAMRDFDPESPNNSVSSLWVNNEVYPLNKTYSFGLSVIF